MGDCHRPPKQAHEKIALEPVAMSLKSLMLLVVVAISIHPSTSSPTISFEAIGKEKDNVIQALGGLKSQLLSPFAGIARVKLTALGAKLGLVKSGANGIIGAKLGLARTVLRPVVGLKRAKLTFLDRKIALLDF